MKTTSTIWTICTRIAVVATPADAAGVDY